MSQTRTVITVTAQTTLSDLIHSFEGSDRDLVFLDENTVISEPHLELLTDYPRGGPAALIANTETKDVLVRANRIVSATSASHKTTVANREFVGALMLSQRQREEVLATLRAASTKAAKGHALELALVALVRATVKVDAVDLKGAPFVRSEDASVRQQTQREIEAIRPGLIRLRLANRANDGFYSVYVLRRFSKILTWFAVKIGATPNQVTLLSFAIGLLSAFMFSRGDFWSLFAGAILLQVSLVVDCVDGELARYTRKFSELGAWLDAITDRVKEYAVFLALAIGALATTGVNLWVPAMAMMAIQTFRHLSDYNFGQIVKARAQEQIQVPVDFMDEWDGIEANEPRPPSRLRYWLGKIVLFPIGERWLVISVSAVIGGAAFTLTVMPILALISMIWVYKVRIQKSLDMPKERIKSLVIVNQLDLPAIKQSFSKRFDWAEPSLLRLLELGVLIWIFATTANLGPSSFVILFAIVFHHYDNLYRAMQSEAKPSWLSVLGLTIPGRILLTALFATLGWNLAILAGYFAVLFLVVSSVQWVALHKLN